jgi:predicted metal-dependent HD superfamily phosphohydrolase
MALKFSGGAACNWITSWLPLKMIAGKFSAILHIQIKLINVFGVAFSDELLKYNKGASLVQPYWSEIISCYSKNNRHYHNLKHLDALFIELSNVREQIKDWTTLIFSIAYHDIKYNVLRNDNEKKSADIAVARLSELGCSPEQVTRCSIQVLATKHHQPDAEMDTNYFTDADLSILGAGEEGYHDYTSAIRKEYRRFPDFIYKPGRVKVLKHFLDMPRIFKTDFFYYKYESAARMNLSNEHASLTEEN